MIEPSELPPEAVEPPTYQELLEAGLIGDSSGTPIQRAWHAQRAVSSADSPRHPVAEAASSRLGAPSCAFGGRRPLSQGCFSLPTVPVPRAVG